jgi:hypothetical protein
MKLATAGLLAIPFVALLGSSEPAEAGVETLRWTHPSAGGVTSFRVHWGTSSRVYSQVVDAGVPSPAAGVYTYTVSVPDDTTVYFAISAYDASTGLSSAFSNERVRGDSGGGGTGGGGTGGGGTGGGGTGGGGTGGGGTGGGGTGGGGTGGGGTGGGEPNLDPPSPSGPGLGPLPGEPSGSGDEPDGSGEPGDPDGPEENPLGAPGRPQVVSE